MPGQYTAGLGTAPPQQLPGPLLVTVTSARRSSASWRPARARRSTAGGPNTRLGI